jgi:hypothetical protein
MKLTDKERMIRILQELPDDSSYEEIFQKLLLGRPSQEEQPPSSAVVGAATPGDQSPG